MQSRAGAERASGEAGLVWCSAKGGRSGVRRGSGPNAVRGQVGARSGRGNRWTSRHEAPTKIVVGELWVEALRIVRDQQCCPAAKPAHATAQNFAPFAGVRHPVCHCHGISDRAVRRCGRPDVLIMFHVKHRSTSNDRCFASRGRLLARFGEIFGG